MKKETKNFLIALLKNESDLNYVLEDHWYRIPISTKRVPLMVKEGYIKYIAFYHNRRFKSDPSLIKYYAPVESISIVKGKDLLPHYKNEPKGDKEYYKLDLGEIKTLARPIVSRRNRRLLFINTTLACFKKANEINYLFLESYLEEKLWEVLRKDLIEAERQYYFRCAEKGYLLDFVLFCRERNINIECDGDEFHMTPKSVKEDKIRDNRLESLGWSVLRYNYDEVTKGSDKVIQQIKETINTYGGLENSKKPFTYKYYDKDKGVIEIE